MSIAEHIKTESAINDVETADTTVDTTADDTSTDTADTTTDTSTEDGATDDDTTEADDSAASAKPKLFMSPKAEQTVKTAPQPKKEGVRAVIRKELEKEYEWTKRAGTREDFDRLVSFRDKLDSAPLQVLNQIVRSLANDPVHRPQLDAYLQSIFQPKQEPVDTDPMPEADTPQGYTKEQHKKLIEWQNRQAVATLRKEQADQQKQATTRQQAEARQHNEYAARAISLVQDQPGFIENKDEIGKVFNDYPRDGRQDEAKLLNKAYLEVMKPKWEQAQLMAGRKAAADDIRKKAGAGIINPSGQSGAATQKAPQGFKARILAELNKK